MLKITVKGKIYNAKSVTNFTRKNIFGRLNHWKSYDLGNYTWITIGLGSKPIFWKRQNKIYRAKFNPKVSGELYANRKKTPCAFVFSFDISKTKFFVVERFPEGGEYRLIGKVL